MPDAWDQGEGAGPAPALAWTGISDKRSYYKLFSAYVIALFATGIVTVALALFAFDLAGDNSAGVLATALSIKMLAYVVAAPVSAALTEGVPRKQLLIALDLIRAASLGLLPFVGAVWQIYALVFVFALASATFTLVYQTIVPFLLGDAEDYAQSLARSRIASELDGAISPMMAAGVLLIAAATGVFVIATLAFLLSAVLVGLANLPRYGVARQGSVWSKVLRGPKLFLAVPEFRGVIALDVAMALATAMVMVNTVVIIQGRLDLSTDAAAIAFFVFGAGSVLGALMMPRILPRVRDRSVMLLGAVMMTAGLAIGSVLQNHVMLLILWGVLGLGVALALTPATFLIRRIAPPADLQTLFAAQFSISNTCLLLAYALAGWIGSEFGIAATFLVMAALAGLATLAAARLWPPETLAPRNPGV